MAAFRRNLSSLLADATEFNGENQLGDVSNCDQVEDEGPDIFIEQSDEVESEEDDEETDLGHALKLQGSVTLKNKPKKKQGRKSVWPDDSINELIDIICEDDYYRKKLIFTNNKAVKNAEIYAKVLKDVKSRFASKDSNFPFTVAQIRIKFKACISICKKAAMTRKTASGIDNFMNEKGYGFWFKKLYPFVESRDSCNPDKAIEPSFTILAQNIDSGPDLESSNGSSSDPATRKVKKDLYVPIPNKRCKKETTNSLLKEAVTTFNNFVAKDPTESLLAYFREESERSRQHERELAQMHMQMWQTMLMATVGPQQNMQGPPINPAPNMASTPQHMHGSQQYTNLRTAQMPTSSARGNNERPFSSWTSYIGQNEDQQF